MYCGKCGSKLDSKGRCPQCSPPEHGKSKVWLVILTAVIIIGGLAVPFCFGRTDRSKPKEPAETTVLTTESEASEPETENTEHEVTEPNSTADVFLREQIEPLFGPVQNELSIPYCSFLYVPETEDYTAGGTYYGVDSGPIALLATEKKDYDHNGVEDLLVIALSAYDADPAIVKACEIPSGMNDLYIDLLVYYFDETDNCIRSDITRFQLGANGQETVALCNADNRVLYLESFDESSSYDLDTGIYYAVTNNITGHSDEVSVYDLSSADGITSDYAAYRKIYFDSAAQNVYDTDYIAHGEIDNEQKVYDIVEGVTNWTRRDMGVLLYCAKYSPDLTDESSGFWIDKMTGVAAWEPDMVRTEQEVCEKISKSLQTRYGADCIAINSVGMTESWERRWENTFVPDDHNDDLLCLVSMESSVSQLREDGLWGGTMVLQIKKTTR